MSHLYVNSHWGILKGLSAFNVQREGGLEEDSREWGIWGQGHNILCHVCSYICSRSCVIPSMVSCAYINITGKLLFHHFEDFIYALIL